MFTLSRWNLNILYWLTQKIVMAAPMVNVIWINSRVIRRNGFFDPVLTMGDLLDKTTHANSNLPFSL